MELLKKKIIAGAEALLKRLKGEEQT